MWFPFSNPWNMVMCLTREKKGLTSLYPHEQECDHQIPCFCCSFRMYYQLLRSCTLVSITSIWVGHAIFMKFPKNLSFFCHWLNLFGFFNCLVNVLLLLNKQVKIMLFQSFHFSNSLIIMPSKMLQSFQVLLYLCKVKFRTTCMRMLWICCNVCTHSRVMVIHEAARNAS